MKEKLRELLKEGARVPTSATDQDMDIIKQAAVACGARIAWEDEHDFRTFSSFHITDCNELHGGICKHNRVSVVTPQWIEILALSKALACPINRVVGGI